MSESSMQAIYEHFDVKFRIIATYEDVQIVQTPEGYRLQCPPPFVRFSRAYRTIQEAIYHAERFCAVRHRMS